jgi:hypothetical protein
MIGHFLDGNLQMSELWAQHNEHRPFTFRIVSLFFVWATNWDLIYEMYFSLFLTIMIFLYLAWLARFTHRSFAFKSYAWLLIFIALLNWSTTQWENFLWSFGMAFFLQNLFALLSIIILTTGTYCERRIILSVICATLSTYSSGAGLVLWPLGLVTLLIMSTNGIIISPRQKSRAFLIWSITTVIVLVTYFWLYNKPGSHPPLWYAMYNPFEMVVYLCGYMGSVFVCHQGELAVVLGGIGVLSWILIIVCLVSKARNQPDLLWRCLPWFMIGNYVFLTELITGVSRVGFGVGQSISSRYITISILFWMSLAAISSILITCGNLQDKESISKYRNYWPKTLIISLLMILLLRADFLSLSRWHTHYEITKTWQKALLLGKNDQLVLEKLFAPDESVRQMNQFLRENHLSIFREQAHHVD